MSKDRHSAVLCTIHQPSSDIFVLFDQVIFMKEGRIFYQGETSTLVSYFSKFGYDCPTNYNPADYVMLLSQTETIESVEKSGIMEANKTAGKEIENDIHEKKSSKLIEFPDSFKANFFKVQSNTNSNIEMKLNLFIHFIFFSKLVGWLFVNLQVSDVILQP